MKYAVAHFDIKPLEFWDLTLAEYNIMMEAHEWRVKEDMWKNAQLASWLLLPHVKDDPITPGELMGEEGDDEDEAPKKTTTKDDINDMKKSMGL